MAVCLSQVRLSIRTRKSRGADLFLLRSTWWDAAWHACLHPTGFWQLLAAVKAGSVSYHASLTASPGGEPCMTRHTELACCPVWILSSRPFKLQVWAYADRECAHGAYQSDQPLALACPAAARRQPNPRSAYLLSSSCPWPVLSAARCLHSGRHDTAAHVASVACLLAVYLHVFLCTPPDQFSFRTRLSGRSKTSCAFWSITLVDVAHIKCT